MSGGRNTNKKQVEKQYEYDKAVHNYGWETKMLKWDQAMSQYNAKIANDRDTRDYEHSQKVAAWEDAEAIRNFKYQNQRAAHNASVKAYNKQLDFNSLAQEISLNDNTRKYNERMTEIGFKNENLMMKFDHTKTAQQQGVRQYKEKALLTEAGLAAGLRDASDQAGFEAREQLSQLEKAKSDAARKGVELTMESLSKQGKVRATGQTGRSARKNLQAVLAEHGRGQAAVVGMITHQEKDNALAFDRIQKKLEQATTKAALDYATLATDVAQTVERADMQILQAQEGTGLGQRELQESLKSATAQKEVDDQNIQIKKYGADLSAENSIAPDAQKEPVPAFPVKIKDPQTVPPPEPSWDRHEAVKPIKGAVSKGPSLISQILSDDRLKYNMNRVGTSNKGIPIYTFKYRHEGKHGPEYIGTSAQDLIQMGRSDAVGRLEKEGFYYVDYSKLDLQFAKVPT